MYIILLETNSLSLYIAFLYGCCIRMSSLLDVGLFRDLIYSDSYHELFQIFPENI